VLAPDAHARLVTVLERAQGRGFVGPGPVTFHVEHAEALASAVEAKFRGRFLDLGAGAGVPGLALLLVWPRATGTLLDSQRRRCQFLEGAVIELGVEDRARVACGRAEELARDPEHRGAYDLVVARGFGSPAVTAECGVGFLKAGGRLVVSEPPGRVRPDRWPPDGVADLGLRGPKRRGDEDAHVAVLTLAAPVSERWPRRTGVPAKRPLWGPT
jgi:16S rRNA (guanine527-N7)-methyltransferase